MTDSKHKLDRALSYKQLPEGPDPPVHIVG